MYDDGDPVLAALRQVALAFPGASEVEAHGQPTFRTRKVFAYYGGTPRGTRERRDRALLVLPPADERAALLADPRCFAPAYLAPSGWVGLDLALPGTSWREVAELLDVSYRESATATLVRTLDAAIAAGTDPVTTLRGPSEETAASA